MARYVIYGETKLPIGDTDSIHEVKESMSKFYPEVKNFEAYTDEENNVRFKSVAGTKGAGTRYVIYGETKLPIGETDSIREVKESMSKFYPEVKNFEAYTDEDNNVRFKSIAGTKGV